MLIIGAKGFAKEVLEVCFQNNDIENLAFYDDVNEDIGDLLYGQFRILKNEKQVKEFFQSVSPKFTIGIGNPLLRYKMHKKFTTLGGTVSSTFSPFAKIGAFGNSIAPGCNVMTSTILTNDIEIGECVLFNLCCTIGHDVIIGDFVEICPDVNISGNCIIGDFSFIGTNATILPGVKIGKNVVIGAGSVVTKNIPDNCMALGTPAKVVKELSPLLFDE
jgi:sugar O-acyltransferase (sialic acid O-acetyltransferase NeuD family)